MVDEPHRAQRCSVSRSLRHRSISALPFGTILNPVAMSRKVRSAARVVTGAVIALPRIALALEQLLSGPATVAELTRLRRTLDRLERLGGFLAEELPEVQHQLESLRKQVGASSNRTDVRLELTEQQLRDTAAAMRSFAETFGGRSGGNPDPRAQEAAPATGHSRTQGPHEQRHPAYGNAGQQGAAHTAEPASAQRGETGRAS